MKAIGYGLFASAVVLAALFVAVAASPAPSLPAGSVATPHGQVPVTTTVPTVTTTPTTSSLLCTASRSRTVWVDMRGLGCRETRQTFWGAQGCAASMGCCANATGCLVPSSTNMIRGDGIY